jgi:mevalonate kinase
VKHVEGFKNRVLIPGKTFLLGEYLALAGGPSIVANTSPAFEFSWELETASSTARTIRHPFHADSPAGRWLDRLAKQTDDPRTFSIQFKDPFNGKGGMGASTAEFAGAWFFRRWLEESNDRELEGSLVESLDDHRSRVVPKWKSERIGTQRFRDVLDDYRQTTLLGSGADLVSQIAGGVAVWDGRIDEMRRFSWPFEDLSMTLVMTGTKMPTHTHLAGLSPLESSVLEDMHSWVEEAVQAFALADGDRLIASVRGFGKVLAENGRLADHSRTLLEELADESGVRAAKGCGAMGSDVLLVLHDRNAASLIGDFCKRNELARAGGDAELVHDGLHVEQLAFEGAV